ncbi:hypothetical protein Tco_0201761 [Tanacetum coccineum]
MSFRDTGPTSLDADLRIEEPGFIGISRCPDRTCFNHCKGYLSDGSSEIRALQARDQSRAELPGPLNNMPPMRSYLLQGLRLLTAGLAAVAAAVTPMTVAAVEQLIEARVSVALANHETLRNKH